jgi:hypothetical protein
MNKNKIFRLFLKRLAIVTVLSLGVIFTASEIFYLLQKESHERAPQQVELVIPLGAAEMVSRGEQVATIPEEMVFMVGDTLVVKNEDLLSHQLGPLWIPANSSASLALDTAARYVESCSFQTSQYLGLDVRQATTLGTRLQALVIAGPATIIFLFIYSVLVIPLDKETKAARKWGRSPGSGASSSVQQISGYTRYSDGSGAGDGGESNDTARVDSV